MKKILLEEEPGSRSWYCLVSREITAERRDLGHLALPLRHEKDEATNPLLFPLPLALTRATTLPLAFTSDTPQSEGWFGRLGKEKVTLHNSILGPPTSSALDFCCPMPSSRGHSYHTRLAVSGR